MFNVKEIEAALLAGADPRMTTKAGTAVSCGHLDMPQNFFNVLWKQWQCHSKKNCFFVCLIKKT